MFDTIVISDQDLERRNVLYEVLSELNYQVTTLPSREELMTFLKGQRPQCAILAAEASEPFMASVLRSLREIDHSLKLIALIPPEQVERVSRAVEADPRVTIVSTGVDRLSLIRAVLTVLKSRDVERVSESAAFQGGILIVDDEPKNAQVLTEYLQRRGYQVTSVPDGEQALVQMRVLAPRIVLLDLLLPGMDGLLTLKRLKTLDHGVAVIVTSGVQEDSVRREAKALGVSAYLLKPFDLATLEAAILTSTLPPHST